jgi:YidC/Oxa1 family membrane protein insertase
MTTIQQFIKAGSQRWVSVNHKPLINGIRVLSVSHHYPHGRSEMSHHPLTGAPFTLGSLSSSWSLSTRNFWSRSKAKVDNGSSLDQISARIPTPPVDENLGNESSGDTQLTDIITPEQAMANFEQYAVSLSTPSLDVASSSIIDPTTGAQSFTATWYYPQDHTIHLLQYIHDISGLNYAWTIALLTVVVRALIFPLFVQAQRNTSRMAHMKPEMDQLKQRMDRLDPSDRDGQLRMGMEMRKLFDKYQCNPFKALLVPLLQAPIFMSMFFALQKMPQFFADDLSQGGILWFTDLAAPDPYHVLPILSAGSFLAIMELGKKQMMASSVNNPAQGRMMINFLRAVAVIMIPLTMDFSTAIFCYWTTNNTISLIQTGLFRSASVRKSLGIWELPILPSSTTSENKGLVETIQDVIQNSNKKGEMQSIKDQIKAHNEAIEHKKKADSLRNKKQHTTHPTKE